MMNKHIKILTVFLMIFPPLMAQQVYNIPLKRGKLWHSFYLTQDVGPMGDWGRVNFGLDWPAFDPDSLKQPIGGANSYMISGGFYIAALNDTGGVLGWADFATKNIDTKVDWSGAANKFLVKNHEKRWKNGENYWLRIDNAEAEDVIDSEWEINTQWFEPTDNPPLPISVRRVVRQWSGSRADEEYVIIEYTIRNIQRRDPLRSVYLLFTHAVSPNHRGWNLLFPNLTRGARNTISRYDPEHRMVISWAGDYRATSDVDESYDPYEYIRYDPVSSQNIRIPEFIAHGAVGIKMVYIPPDTNGVENKINGFAWSAGAPSQDVGPFQEVQGVNAKYAATADPTLLTRAFTDPNDEAMGESRLYTNFSLGPFNIDRRDSIRIVIAEFVGGASYEKARDPDTTPEMIRTDIDSAVAYLNRRIEYNFNNGYRVPMPPEAPVFTLSSDTRPEAIGTIISFGDEKENIPDPHQGVPDLAGYRIYRSKELPFGPWEKIAEISKGDAQYYDQGTGTYTYIDSLVALGFGYSYSVTSFDNGHPGWTVNGDPVPPLESSIFANRQGPVNTTLRPAESAVEEVVVVPNPFYRQSGFLEPGSEKDIQFVGVPGACTLRIFTIRGDLVKTIRHNNLNSGVIRWNQISDFGQYVKSGMYFFHLENDRGDAKRGKFAIIN